jgi:hypothetical protein
MTSIQNTKKFRDQASMLRDHAARHGITMLPGEATALLADRLTAVAQQFGISERWALDRYVNDDFIATLVQAIASHAATYQEVVQATEPVSLTTAQAGQILAALGMALKLAAIHAEQTSASSMAMLTDGADTVVAIGAALNAADGTTPIELGGHALVWTRTILVETIGLIRAGQWECPCNGTHAAQPTCTLVPRLARDLNLIGGWLPAEPAAPTPVAPHDPADGW